MTTMDLNMTGWVQVAAGAGAAILSLLLLVIFVLIIRSCQLRNRNRNKMELQKRSKLDLEKLFRRASSTRDVVATHQNAPGDDPIYRWGPNCEPSPYWELTKAHEKGSTDSLTSSTEMLDQVDGAPKTARKDSLFIPDNSDSGGGGGSGGGLQEVPAAVDESPAKQLPKIEFQVIYVSQTSTLRVRVVRVINLPFKYRKNCSSFVKVALLARRKSSAQTNVVRKSLNPEYEQCFAFPGYALDEVKRSSLRFTVLVKRQFGQLKDRPVGDALFPMATTELPRDQLITCTEPISPPPKKNSQIGKRPSLQLGQLFVLLQYQASAGRMKVLVRKAEHLPSTGRGFIQPDYYIIVNLVRGHEVVSSNETRGAAGSNPVWNQPFLFEFTPDDVGAGENEPRHWLQFVVMRGRLYSKDGIVGHVPIGPATTLTGAAHWHEAMTPRAQEVAKWHSVQPL